MKGFSSPFRRVIVCQGFSHYWHWSQTVLCYGGIFGSTPGPYSLDATSTSCSTSPLMTTKNSYRHCQCSLLYVIKISKARDFIIWLALKLLCYHAIKFHLKHSLESKYSSVYIQKLDNHWFYFKILILMRTFKHFKNGLKHTIRKRKVFNIECHL